MLGVPESLEDDVEDEKDVAGVIWWVNVLLTLKGWVFEVFE
jgi:hypothetical protein